MSLTTEYFLLATAAALGFIQLAVGNGGLKGLMFIPNPESNRNLAMVITVPAMILFFTWNYRNPVGIIEGAQQAGLFSLASLSAVALTLLVSSLVNHRRMAQSEFPDSCMEALKKTTFFRAMVLRYLWKR